MRFPTLVLAFALAAQAASAQLVKDVRDLLAKPDFAAAEAKIEDARRGGPWTPEQLLAHSWLGRAAQANKQWDKALEYAAQTRKLAIELAATRPLDQEPNLPLALGASFEVTSHALANTGRLSEALLFLTEQLEKYKATSIRARTQKNIHLLSLVGKPAPELEHKLYVGKKKLKSLKSLRGSNVLLFLWAHWCSDCKAQGPILAQLAKDFPELKIVAPTQHYGYKKAGEDATKPEEFEHIKKVQAEHFKLYGVSTTPTLVLIDKSGAVRLYNPGRLTKDQLEAALKALPN
jgi:thiol-disulfide isomerase/thioredoxin